MFAITFKTIKKSSISCINNNKNIFNFYSSNLKNLSMQINSTNYNNDKGITCLNFNFCNENKYFLDNIENSRHPLEISNNTNTIPENIINGQKEKITAEFLNKTSRLAKRKRNKRKTGRKTSLRYK
jgi:hypothetical protein